jgi:dephospho-CoA kinase
MDVPLLYESGFPIPRDLELVVACGPTTQKTRLMARNGHSSDLADRMLSAQLPIAAKMNRADVVLWNGGTPNSLLRQTELFILWLKNFPRP